MIKVVIDTNIYISAVLFGGNAEGIRKLAREGKIELLVSENILTEIAGVFKRKFNWYDWQISELITDIRAFATLVTPRLSVSVINEDKPDNRFLECAIEGKARYIITGDKQHLQSLKEYQGIKILSPAKFLEVIRLNK